MAIVTLGERSKGKNVNGPDKNCPIGRADKFLDFE